MNFYFSKLKIPGPRPLPILGNFYDVIKRGLPYNDLALIKKYGRTIGYFEGTTPVVLTADSKFIKSILIKDFKTFANRKLIGAANIAPFNKFVSLMKDDEWKSVRAILSTMFTSGKLKSVNFLFKLVYKLKLTCTYFITRCFFNSSFPLALKKTINKN